MGFCTVIGLTEHCNGLQSVVSRGREQHDGGQPMAVTI
jgi:hypothetical protein